MANTTLVASVTGIVVSGLVGPSATAWASRRAARKQFLRDRAAAQRDELRTLLDEAAVTLGLAGPRLRLAERKDGPDFNGQPDSQPSWSEQIFTLGQRLRLRLRSQDPVVVSYEQARQRLIVLASTAEEADEARREDAFADFEAARDAFLAASQTALDDPIPDEENT